MGVAYSQLLLTAVYFVVFGPFSDDLSHFDLRVGVMVVNEIMGLLLLVYVLARQGRNFQFLTSSFKVSDLWHTIVLVIGAYLAYYLIYYIVYYGYWFSTRQVLEQADNVFLKKGFAVSIIALILVNPFFEEVIGRAYLITQLREFRVGSMLAVVISVALPTILHFYQGVDQAVAMSGMCLIFSIYYVKTRRLYPLVLAHLILDFAPFFFKGE